MMDFHQRRVFLSFLKINKYGHFNFGKFLKNYKSMICKI